MRRRSVILGVLVVAMLVVPTGPAAATPTRATSKAFCTTMNHFLGFMQSAPRPSSLRRPAGRRLIAELRTTAPRSVASAAKTLTRSLEHVATHGKHSLSRRANDAANQALFDTAQYVVDHCTSSRETRAYAQLISGGTADRHAPGATPLRGNPRHHA